MKKGLLSIFLLIGYTLGAQNLSNRGTEFWVGYGHNALFGNVNGSPNSQEMVLYLGATQAATVTVSINGTAYSAIYNIPANSVIQTATIPKTGANDARLIAEGLSTKGIHIVSDVPIVAYAHQYGLNSSGATMLMPVETYAYTYYSLNYTQLTNVDPSYSWFYVVASENNTTVQITPSVLTDGGKPAGVPFNVNLNKGEIYNVFGQASVGTGFDVTGSKVQSIAGTDAKCHPIAVFSGSSRITICGNSGDILQQQIFPSSAWGTNYFTYPTISTNNITQTNLNYYRIAVRDPSTIIKKNGAYVTGLINNFYYEYSSSGGDFIEANKPILISQYVPSMQNCNIYDGNGDPEMFYLSPLQQAVNQTSFYSTNNQNIQDNYVSLIIKTAGLSSLLIDGSSTFSSVVTHPQNPLYSVVIQSLTGNQQHIISSDSSFTAITYGFGNFESYGYNAGTLVNNLDIIPSIKNTLSSGTKPSVSACPRSPFNISVRMAYKPTKAVWHFSNVTNLTPGYDTTFLNPVPYDSVIIDARTYYGFKLPNTYVFSDTGTYNIPISVTAPEIDNCNHTLDFIYTIVVHPIPNPAILVNYSKCLKDTANFLTTGINGIPIQNFIWTFDDGTKDYTTHPTKTFPIPGPHLVKLRVITYDGCVADTSITPVSYVKPTATFGIAPLPACEGSTVTFSDTSFFGGTLSRWYWDFGNGQVKNVYSTAPQIVTYPTAGIYNIKHLAQSTGTCASDTARKTIQIFAKPKAKFGEIMGCLFDSTVRFFDSTKISDGQALTYAWVFGDPNATVTNPNTSTIKNPLHKYIVSGRYKVTLTVTTANGCSSIYSDSVTVYPLPLVDFNINAPIQCVNGNSYTFTNTSTIAVGTNTFAWTFGDGGTSTIVSPLHSYTASGTYNVRLIATSDKSCKDTTIKVVTVNPKPTPNFNVNIASQCVTANSFTFTNTSALSAGSMTYNWFFGDGGTSNAQSPVHNFVTAGSYQVKLIVTSDKGCKDSLTKLITVNPKPVAAFTINNTPQCQAGNSFSFTNTSSVASGTISYSWNFGDGLFSTSLNPTHGYTSPGTYIVKLIVTSNFGCIDSVTHTLNVLAKPTASFSVNDSDQCFTANNFVFTNTSSTTSGTINSQWYFGDGGNSVLVSPSHNYVGAGTYIVKLVVTTSNGCKDSLSKTVIVYPKPAPAFTINNNVQCLSGNTFIFTSNSTITSGVLNYQWFFGDGNIAATQNATHIYITPGTFSVKLIVTSNKGCKDSITKTITIIPRPIASFTINNAAQCITANSFVFTSTSTPSAAGTLTYQWTFGDGGTSVLQSPSHSYTIAGTFIVKLVVTESTNGCKDTISKTIVVGPKPVANYTIANATQCLTGNLFSFTNTSTLATGILTYQWSFGDGANAISQNATHSYVAPGTYTVRLIITSDKGCIDSISKTITVNPKPVASYSVNNASQCLTGNTFVFTNTSSISSGIISYKWNFGDGSNSTTVSPTHSYTTAGSYIVMLVVTSNNGCTDTARQTITVNPKPAVSFTINDPAQCLNGNSFILTNTSTIATGNIAYQWNFGDGGSSTLQNPTHSYAAAGLFKIRLIVISDKGCIDSLSKTISVVPKPVAAFSINSASQCFGGNSFVFSNSTTDPVGTLTYQWYFGDGTTSTLTNPTHNYSAPGSYMVKLVAIGGSGCKDSITHSITVNPKPVAVFSINDSTQCFKSNNLVFTGTSAIATGSLTYQWYFGDGATSTFQSPAHSYLAAGIYSVKLVATSDQGCKDSLTKTVIIYPMPVAAFAVNTTSQCLTGNSFSFTNTSSISTGTLTYQWFFGDGGVASTLNATHIYSAAGSYVVKLVVTSAFGCKDSVVNTVVINPQSTVGFTIANAAQCVNGNVFSFNNTSSITTGTITYQWTFGDGIGTSSLQNPTYSYSTAGNYNVKLVVTTNNGCKDSTTKPITVYPKPNPFFTINSAMQCTTGNSFVFTNGSAIAYGSMSYIWKFGDGDTSHLQSPTHAYINAGTYTVWLVAVSNNGCSDSISRTVTISPRPVAAFSINNPGQCLLQNNFVFTNTSSIATGTITYQWSFGDGGVSTVPTPSHTYLTSGNYTVKLIVTSGSGCKDTLSQPIVVYAMPVATFTVNNTLGCLTGNAFTFTNTGTAVALATYNWTFGDGNTSAIQNPTYSYSSAGTFSVRLIVTSANGCKDTSFKTINIYPMPVAAFNVNSTGQCISGNSFVFANNSSITTGTISSQWNFGDGNVSTVTTPTHVYTTAGTYIVKLVVTSALGCKDSTFKTVIVYPKPTVSFTANSLTQCFKNNQFIFTNTSVFANTATYQWTFGDGATSTQTSPAHNYTTPGTFTVRLIVTTNFGCVDSISQQVTVYPQPQAQFSVNSASQCLVGNSFVFTNNTTIASGSYNSFWNFGDGITSTAASLSHTYTTAGTYIVKLLVVSNLGCKDSVVSTVTVNPQATASFTVNTLNQCLNGNSYSFTNTSTNIGNPTYQWTFGDGGSSNVYSPSHVYTSAGTYTVKLIVTTVNGCQDSLKQVVVIYPKPTASFSINGASQCFNGNSFTFANGSTLASGSFSSSWSFGDGQTSGAISPSHTYNASGLYNVKLVVTTNNGCKDSIILPVTVYPKPTVSFSINDTTQCLSGNTFTFSDGSVSVGASTYSWNFGDGSFAASQNATHTYTSAGTYIVKLVVTSGNGCKDSLFKTMVVYPKPMVVFAINNNTQCFETNNFVFTNNTTLSSGTFTADWNLGDGSFSASQNATHTYTTSGNYAVKLIITTSDGCKDSATQNIVVNKKPAASFGINDSSQCLVGNNFQFNNTSAFDGTPAYQWNFGDAATAATASPSHTYASAGVYTVKMVVISGFGCRDSITRKVIVFPKVTAAFTINKPAQCLDGNSFVYTNGSSVSSGTLTMLWNLGDGATDNQLNTVHHYNSSNTFIVKLTATSADGCVDTISKPVIVNAMPVSSFTVNNTVQCFRGNNFVFTNTSPGVAALASKWKFGDGNTSNVASPPHHYLNSGTDTVALITTTIPGCADTAIKVIVINPQPVATFAILANGQCVNNNSYTFNNASTLSSGVFTNAWSFGDAATSVALSPVHSYVTANTFSVRLITTSDKGCSDTMSLPLTVKPKPSVSFTINNAGQCLGANSFVFTNTSTGVSPVSQLWTLGNGITAAAHDTVYKYTSVAAYNVQLRVTADGCSDSITKPVVVYPMPVASFTINDAIQCLIGNYYSFNGNANISSGTLLYNYSFDDGSSSTLQSPVHTFATPNNYMVKQTVTTDKGCVDSVKQPVQVLVNPRAKFSVNNASQCLNSNNFVFTNNSVAPSGTTYSWSFGNGTTSTDFSPRKSYTSAAAYKVTLYLTATSGCKSDTATTSVSVFPNPVVNTGHDLAVLEGTTVLLNAQVANGLTYFWSPGTYLSSIDVQTPLTTPHQSIGYRLTATGLGGCTGYDSVYVKILKPPTIPNVFSPNGDGVNDTWIIKYLSDFPGCTVEVFNRYGAQVFISNGYAKPWDGTHNGTNLPVGTYYYIVDPKNGIGRLTGNVTILR